MEQDDALAAPAAVPETGTVHRALRLLSTLAEREQWPLNELARELRLPRATAHRLLNLCKPLGFVEQDESGSYRAGIELFRIAGKLSTRAPINRIADPLLQAIRDETQETATLTLLARPELKMFFSHVAYPANRLRYSVDLNRLQPLAWGAAGQGTLAWLADAEIEEVIGRREASPLGQPPLTPQQLRQQLAAIRERGYAESFGARVEDMHGLAVPFFDRGGQVRGNILLTIPHFRFSPDSAPQLVELLLRSAAQLTRQLGWSD